MPKYDLSQASNKFYYYGKVIRSYVGPASAEYMSKANNRAGDQWHLEIEPLSFKYASGGTRTKSQNLPTPGMAPREDSALIARYKMFKELGFDMPTDDDFGKIEGHIFYFVDEERAFGRFKKRDDWPIAVADEYEPGDEVPVIGSAESNGAHGDPFELVAGVLDGKPVGVNVLSAVMLAGNQVISGSQEIMSLAQKKGALVKELEERGLIKVEGDMIIKA